MGNTRSQRSRKTEIVIFCSVFFKERLFVAGASRLRRVRGRADGQAREHVDPCVPESSWAYDGEVVGDAVSDGLSGSILIRGS
jgi:hypothetical protein